MANEEIKAEEYKTIRKEANEEIKAKIEEYKTRRKEAEARKYRYKIELKKREEKKRIPTAKTQKAFFKLFGSTSSSDANRPVGRPRGLYKNPAGVPAQEWYKIRRALKRQAEAKAMRIQQIMQQQVASKGITPQQLQQMKMAQLRQKFQSQSPPQPQTQIAQIQPAQRTIWNRNWDYQSEETDIMGNKRMVVRGRPESFWN